MNLITEKELQATIIEAFESVGRRVFHVSNSLKQVRDGDGYALVGDPQTTGYPDLTIAGGGEIIWAELKSEQGKLEPEQVEWLDALPAHRAHVWRTEDLDLDLAVRMAESGSDTCGRTCWSCSREKIIGRIGVKRGKGKRPRPRVAARGNAGRRKGKTKEKNR